MNSRAILIITFLLLSGCTTTIPPEDKLTLAPPVTGMSTIYLFNSVEGINVILNGKDIGGLLKKSYTWFYLAPGKHYISYDDSIITGRQLVGLELDVKENETYYLQYTWDYNSPQADVAILADSFLYSTSEKRLIDVKPLELISQEDAFKLKEKYNLVGNKAD